MERLRRVLIFIALLIIYVIIEKVFRGYLTLAVPVILIALSYWIINKYLNKNKKPLFFSYSLMVGHILWYFVGIAVLIYFRNQYETLNNIYNLIYFGSLLDIGIMMALTIWLVARLGLFSVIVTLIFLFMEIVLASIYISEVDNKLLLKSQLMHLTLFAITFIAIVQGLYFYRKNKSKVEENQFSTPSNITP